MKQAQRIRFAKDKRDPGAFVPVPCIVLRSERFAHLSKHATKLFMDLLAQYRGDNNGDLVVTWSVVQARGWRSHDTLAAALAELIETGFVSQTRQGGRHAASLYGITIFALDYDPKYDIAPGDFPRGAWARGQTGDGPKVRAKYHGRCAPRRVNSRPIEPPGGIQGAPQHAN